MAQQSVIGEAPQVSSVLPSNSALVFGRILQDDLYSNFNQTDSSTVIITPKYNTTGKIELKIGVLLPFTQKNDNVTAEIVWGGSSAIRMAVNYINSNEIIPGAYITLVEKDSFPDASVNQMSVTNAVYASVTLLQESVIGVIGDVSNSWTSLSALMTSTLQIPQCSFTANAVAFSDKTQYKYFFRTIPTQVLIADVMLSFATKQGWNKLGVLYTDESLGQQFYQRALIQANTMDLHILRYQSISTSISNDGISDALRNMTNNGGARIIMVAAGEKAQSQIMLQAYQLGLLTEDYVWLLMGDTTDALQAEVEAHNQNLTAGRIDYATAYQGLFLFDNWLSLDGYQPFEDFLDQWSALNPQAYPYAGHRNITSYEGLAYSCMMVMAEGFQKLVKDSTNQTDNLLKLAYGELGDKLVPSTFNVGYVGPEGPMIYDSNGDLTTGNYLVYNLQAGIRTIIGKSTGGKLNMTAQAMFFDGTNQPPLDSAPSVALNPDLSSPISHAILAISSTGIIFSIICFFIVLANRKNEVFKASSPLFCCLELVGFVLTYVSVLMMIGIPTAASCVVTPITFSLGFILVLANMIAKNYRIYRIFNNIFITSNVITDVQLIRTVVALVGLEMIILVSNLVVARPIPTKLEVNFSSHYWVCEAQGSTSTRLVFLILSTIYAGCLLLFATFLAYKTRFAGKQYSRYSETKQMGLSVYNILFSALIGFAVMVNPLADFYTKYYIEAIAILWATTFSLLILFLPKLQAFYRFKIKEMKHNIEERNRQQQQQQPLEKESFHSQHRKSIFSFLKASIISQQYNDFEAYNDNNNYYHQPPRPFHSSNAAAGGGTGGATGGNELLSLEQILASDAPILIEDDDDDEEYNEDDRQTQNKNDDNDANSHRLRYRKSSVAALSTASTQHQALNIRKNSNNNGNNMIEVYQGEMPIRKVFRYFPFLSQWEMQHIMVFPWLSYFSHFSANAKKGTVLSYHHATIQSAKLEDYVLKLHGQGWYDVYIQLPDLQYLTTWEQCFNLHHDRYRSNSQRPDYLIDLQRQQTKTNEATEKQLCPATINPNYQLQQQIPDNTTMNDDIKREKKNTYRTEDEDETTWRNKNNYSNNKRTVLSYPSSSASLSSSPLDIVLQHPHEHKSTSILLYESNLSQEYLPMTRSSDRPILPYDIEEEQKNLNSSMKTVVAGTTRDESATNK